MSHLIWVFFITLLLVHYTNQSPAQIQAQCKENVTLSCSNLDVGSLDFYSVTWYKLDNNNIKKGIIRREKDSKAEPYNFTRQAELSENYNLFLTSVKPEDSGIYDCTISAKVGKQNRNFSVRLAVHECKAQTDVVTPVLNVSQPTPPCQIQVQDFPVKWSIVAYVLVSLIKITLCLIGIKVCGAIFSKRCRYRW